MIRLTRPAVASCFKAGWWVFLIRIKEKAELRQKEPRWAVGGGRQVVAYQWAQARG